MTITELHKLRKENNFDEFYKKISNDIMGLKKFAFSKLKLAENEGLIDKGFYDVNGILDEVYLEVFNTLSQDTDEKQLKQTLFLKIIKKIDEKIEKEDQFKESINLDAVLKAELNLLNENYSVEADGDYVFDEELDDISYRQNSFRPTHFILDHPMEMELTGKLDLSDASLFSNRNRVLFGASFYTLPPISKNIIELYVFGNQEISDIAETLSLDEEMVGKVIDRVRERLEML